MTEQSKAVRKLNKCNDWAWTALFGLLCCFVAAMQYLWLTIDTEPPFGMGVFALNRGIRLFHLSQTLPFFPFLKELFAYDSSYPQFMSWAYSLHYRVFGLNNLDYLVNIGFLLIGIFGTYKVGALFFNKKTGIIAATIVSAFPGVYNYCKSNYAEFFLFAFTPVALYCLLRSKVFRVRLWSLLFAMTCAIMMNIRPHWILFFIMPLSVFGALLIFQKDKEWAALRYQLLNILFVIVVFIMLGLPWYLINWRPFCQSMIYRIAEARDAQFSAVDITYYVRCLPQMLIPEWCIWFAGVVLLMSGIYTFVTRRLSDYCTRLWYLAFFFLVPFLIFSFIQVKDWPHLLPILPAIGLIMAGGLMFIPHRSLKTGLALLLVLYGLSAPAIPVVSPMAEMGLSDTPRIQLCGRLKYSDIYGMLRFPVKSGHASFLNDAVNIIERDYGETLSNAPGGIPIRKPKVMAILNKEPISVEQFFYYNLKYNEPLEIFYHHFPFMDDDYDYIVRLTPASLVFGPFNISQIESILDFIDNAPSFAEHYSVLSATAITKTQQGIIYKRNRLPQ
jgi:hypothetical protein